VLSYLILRGKCRSCGAGISPRYPLVEALTSALLVLSYYFYGPSIRFAADFIFISLLIIISFIDIEHYLIHDLFVIAGIVLAFAYHIFAGTGIVLPLIGLSAGFVSFYSLRFIGGYVFGKEALGEGDIKLAVMLGAFLGMSYFALTIFLASFIGLIVAAPLLLFKKIRRDNYLPFGAFLSAGAVITLFFGERMLRFFGF